VVELGPDAGGEVGFGDEALPVEQQVVVIEQLVGLLAPDVTAKQLGELGLEVEAPRESFLQRPRQRVAGIDRARVDREAGLFLREPAPGGRKPELVPDHVHDVRGIAAIQHRERRVEAQVGGELPQQAIADCVERPRPGQRDELASVVTPAHRLAHDGFDPAGHLLGRAPREGQEEDALRRDARHHEVRNPVRQGHRLAGPGARNHEQRAAGQTAVGTGLTVLGRRPLRGIQGIQVVIALGDRNHASLRGSVHPSSTG